MASLQFIMTTDPSRSNVCNSSNSSNGAAAEFRPDPEKKSAFWIEHCSCASPAHAYINCPQSFFLGGLQLISNARTVEIYLKKNDDELHETYLTTCRGIPAEGHYKILCVIPGGPRQIQQARLKFSTKDDESEFTVISLRVTARIPGMTSPSSHTTAPTVEPLTAAFPDHNPVRSSPPPTATPPPLSSNHNTNDWNTAVAGLAFLIRNTSDKQTQKLETMERQQQTLESRILQQPVCAQVTSQSALLMKQNEQIQQQTLLLLQQQEQIQALTCQVQELANLVQLQLAPNTDHNDPSVHHRVCREESDPDGNEGDALKLKSDKEEMHRLDVQMQSTVRIRKTEEEDVNAKVDKVEEQR